jgi:transcriptional regulator with XRE-family HTH domain
MSGKRIEPVYADLGRRVRALREDLGLTQDEVAQLMGWTRASVANIEGGKQRVLFHSVFDLAAVFDVEPHMLFSDWQPDFSPRVNRVVRKRLDRIRRTFDQALEEIETLALLGGEK